jgi:glycosyltransferase involved in cell wall biosynthesis
MLLSNGLAPDPRVEAEARALARAGADVTIVGWDRDGDLPETEELPVAAVGRDDASRPVHVQRFRLASTHGRGTSQILRMPSVWRRFVRMGREIRPDVVHAHDLDTLPAGYALARAGRAALVFDAHESYPDMLARNVAAPVRAACRALERFLVPRADLLVTVGEKLRSHYEAMGARQSVVVGNWRDPVPEARRPEVRQALRESVGVAAHGVFICFIAHLTRERRLEPLLAAVDAMPSAWLVVGGTGPAEGLVSEAARQCSRIRYLGRVASGDVARWTAASDAVYYGFDPANPNARFSAPNKLFEALAGGVPILTARFGEIGEVVAATNCGLLLPEYTTEALCDAIEALSDPRRRARLRAAAVATAPRFTRRAADRVLVNAYGTLSRDGSWRLSPDAA